MGFYADRVYPRLLDVAMNTKETRRVRRRVCAPVAGDVVEIGFGTGHNLPFLPPAVTRLWAVDPLLRGRVLAAERIAAAPFPVELVGLDGQRLPFEEHSVDAVLSTWTLCSIPDVGAALAEIRRVLRPGGALHFAEHGLAPDESVRRWQHRWNPIQNRLACGCNVTRDIAALVEESGLTTEHLDTYYAKGEPKVLGWTFEGRATAA